MFPRRKNVIPRGEEGRAIRERFNDESACKRCGKCCYQGFVVKGYFILMPDLPCRYLVSDGNGHMVCSEYERRHEIEWCNPANPKTARQGLFPPDCAYVQGIKNYHGKIPPPEGQKEKIRKILYKRVKEMQCPEHLKQEDWLRFLIRISKPVV